MPSGYCKKTGKPFKPPSQLGKKHSKETKEKIRLARLGKKRPPMLEEQKKKISNTLKKKYASGELKKVISEKQKEFLRSRRGSLSPNWRGGKSKKYELLRGSAKWREWRKKVFERDNYICQKCEQRGGILEPHHIKPVCDYPELVYSVKNGQTLCKKCHRKISNKQMRNNKFAKKE